MSINVGAPFYEVTVVMQYTHPKKGTWEETVTANTFMEMRDITNTLARSQRRNASKTRAKVRAVEVITRDEESERAWEIALRLAYKE